MESGKKVKVKYVAFLRGINVGGHHKVPMADLKKVFEKLGLENIVTLLNSGNIIFEATSENILNLEKTISGHLETSFGFSIPTLIKRFEDISRLLKSNPFKDIKLTDSIRLYVSFLRKNNIEMKLPWKSADNSYEIIKKTDKTVLSVLDLSVSTTPKAMEALEQYFGQVITTRNWNTIVRIGKKL